MIWIIVILFLICIGELLLLGNLYDKINTLRDHTYTRFLQLEETMRNLRVEVNTNNAKFRDIEKAIVNRLTKPKKKVTKKARNENR